MNTMQHELDRIASMTDDQLDRRYAKMTKPEKIEAFHRALVLENRNPSLQKRISNDHGLGSGESWELVRHLPPSKDTWKFCVFDENNIQIFHNDVADNSKFANGLYRTAQARTKWDELVAKGYEVKQ